MKAVKEPCIWLAHHYVAIPVKAALLTRACGTIKGKSKSVLHAQYIFGQKQNKLVPVNEIETKLSFVFQLCTDYIASLSCFKVPFFVAQRGFLRTAVRKDDFNISLHFLMVVCQ